MRIMEVFSTEIPKRKKERKVQTNNRVLYCVENLNLKSTAFLEGVRMFSKNWKGTLQNSYEASNTLIPKPEISQKIEK